jgi:L-ribulokinase
VIGFGVSEYPVHKSLSDPDFATQSHAAHLQALIVAMKTAVDAAHIKGRAVRAIAIDTTGSSVVVVDEHLEPLGDYYLWCDHRASAEAARITEVARARGLPQLELCGGAYSSEWGFAKLLHWLRHNPGLRGRAAHAFEHCDLMAAALTGITEPEELPRSICAMGHKWMWSAEHGGFPPNDFLAAVDPLLGGAARLLRGRYRTSRSIAGNLSPAWAELLGLEAGIPIPVGALDAHWDAIGSGIADGDVVNVVGSSTCIMAIARTSRAVPGVSGVVPGSIHPDCYGIEAGLSAVGQLFLAIARRAGQPVADLAQGLEHYRAGQTGLLRLVWDNGDRTVLVNPNLGGVTLGWNLGHTAKDELFAAIEGTAFHTRIILERMEKHGVPIRRIIHGGGIPQKNEVLNQVYANVLGKPVLLPQRPITSLGSAIFACLAAGLFPTVEAAQAALCPPYRIVTPDPDAHAVYQTMFPSYRDLYFALGCPESPPITVGTLLPTLRSLARTPPLSPPQ